jgi:hypothetical protein
MNKEQQIEKDRLIQIEEIDELIREKFHGQVAYRMDISKYGGFNGYTPLCTYDISKALYNAGYRKLPEDSVVLSREEHEILVKTAQGKIGNMKATDFLKACISSGFMVEAVSTKEQVKQAVKEFAEKLKKKVHNYYPSIDSYCTSKHVILVKDIDELLKEYEQ